MSVHENVFLIIHILSVMSLLSYFTYRVWLRTFHCFTKELVHISALIICPFVGTSHNSDAGLVTSPSGIVSIPIHPIYNVSVCPSEDTVNFMIRCAQPHSKNKNSLMLKNLEADIYSIFQSVDRAVLSQVVMQRHDRPQTGAPPMLAHVL